MQFHSIDDDQDENLDDDTNESLAISSQTSYTPSTIDSPVEFNVTPILSGDEQFGLEYLDDSENFCAATTAGRRGEGYINGFSHNQDRFTFSNNIDAFKNLSDSQLKIILHNAFYIADLKVKAALSSLSSDSGKVPEDSGSTALVSYKQGNRIFIANAGDCRATLVHKKNNKYHIKHLTQEIEHRTSLVKEQERIKRCGGNIVHGRLERGGLANTRGLGAPDYVASGFSCVPDFICVRDIDLTDSFLLNSTDGFWEHVKDEEIVDFFNIHSECTLEDRAKELRKIAYNNKNQDNITVGILKEGMSGIFDGFGDYGDIAAQTAAENFTNVLTQSLGDKHLACENKPFVKIERAQIPNAMEQNQKTILNALQKTFTTSTSTLSCLVFDKYIFVARLGAMQATLIYKEGGAYFAKDLTEKTCTVTEFYSKYKHAYVVISNHGFSNQTLINFYTENEPSSYADKIEALRKAAGNVDVYIAKISPGDLIYSGVDRNQSVEFYKNMIVELLEPYVHFKKINKFKNKLLSGELAWDQNIALAMETRYMLDMINSHINVSEKIHIINQYYSKNVELPGYHYEFSESTVCPETMPIFTEAYEKEYKNLIIAIAIIAVCTIIGGLLGAFCGGGLGGVVGATEGAAIGFGIAAPFTAGIYWRYRKSPGSMDAACAAVSAVKYQPTFSLV